MYPCLYVDEILRLIFRNIKDRSTLCALARTCRAFHEPAMNLIWESLTSFEPILRNLSSASVVSKLDARPCLTLSRPLNDNDWNIVRRLSSRVRRFRVLFDPVPHYLNTALPWFGCLTSPQDPSSLFPNLRELSFGVSVNLGMMNTEDVHGKFQTIIRFFRLLLKPHLSALRIDIPGAFYAHLDLPSIPALCPNIRILSMAAPTFKLDGAFIPDEVGCFMSKLVSELCALETVKSDVTSWDFLSTLAQLKGLRQLWVHLPYQLSPAPECPTGDTFPQLRILNIRANSLAPCIDLFRWTSFGNKVAEICVCFSESEDDSDPAQALVDISSLISSQYKTLESIWSIFLDDSPYNYPSSTSPRPMLEPYQACHRLRVIALETPCNRTLTDNDLEKMVFHLFQHGKKYLPVQLTLRGVAALLVHCPKLTQFTLMFDATKGTPRFNSGFNLPPVKYMGVCKSPVSANSDVAVYISTILPYLRTIGVGEYSYEGHWRWISTQHQRRPGVVTDMSPARLYSLLHADTENITSHRGREWQWRFGGD
ncbi:hypothetical protein EDC04DRAFT_2609953 [Pisolithus marmoratus]|nr:hypothetical protein EDC04DRAFT_2609953 [Pisolithus marmoratus]